MTAFADFLDLRTAVIEHVGRAEIADVMPRLTALAEADFNRRIRHGVQVATDTLVFTGGIAPLPADYLEVIGIYNDLGHEYPLQSIQRTRASRARTMATIVGQSVRIEGFEGDLNLDYYAQIPTITTAMNATNWLLQRYPDVYLYGVGVEAAKHVRDADLAQVIGGLYQAALNNLHIDDDSERYARAQVRIAGCVP